MSMIQWVYFINFQWKYSLFDPPSYVLLIDNSKILRKNQTLPLIDFS